MGGSRRSEGGELARAHAEAKAGGCAQREFGADLLKHSRIELGLSFRSSSVNSCRSVWHSSLSGWPTRASEQATQLNPGTGPIDFRGRPPFHPTAVRVT
jgi:hypothetical protein